MHARTTGPEGPVVFNRMVARDGLELPT